MKLVLKKKSLPKVGAECYWMAGYVLLFNLLIGIVMGSADYSHYIQFADTLRGFHLLVNSSTISPVGHPMCYHSFGPALFWIPGLIFGDFVRGFLSASHLHWNPAQYAYLSQFLLLPLLIIAAWKLTEKTQASIFQRLLGMVCAFGGTCLMFYTVQVSSELTSVFMMTTLVWFLCFQNPLQGKNWVYLGILSAGAVLVRTDNIAFITLIFSGLTVQQIAEGRPYFKRIRPIFFAGLLVIAGMLPVWIANYLSTGNFFRSAFLYQFPAGEYFNIGRMHIFEPLFYSRNGALLYNPVVLLTFLALGMYLIEDWNRLKAGEIRKFFARPITGYLPYIAVIYCVARVVMIGGQRGWWSGTGSFGGRYFVNLFPAFAAVFAYLFRKWDVRSVTHPLAIVALGLTVWTLSLEGRFTNYPSYREIFTNQWGVIQNLFTSYPVWVLLLANGFVMLIAAYIFYPPMKENQVLFLSLLSGLGFLFAYSLFYLKPVRDFSGLPPMTFSFSEHIFGSLFCGAGAFGLYHLIQSPPSIRMVASLFAVLIAFLCFVGFNSLRRAPDQPILRYKFCAPFEVEDWVSTYAELTMLPGYEDEKKEFRQLLERYYPVLIQVDRCLK